MTVAVLPFSRRHRAPAFKHFVDALRRPAHPSYHLAAIDPKRSKRYPESSH